jgi:hypothetical protein
MTGRPWGTVHDHDGQELQTSHRHGGPGAARHRAGTGDNHVVEAGLGGALAGEQERRAVGTGNGRAVHSVLLPWL